MNIGRPTAGATGVAAALALVVGCTAPSNRGVASDATPILEAPRAATTDTSGRAPAPGADGTGAPSGAATDERIASGGAGAEGVTGTSGGIESGPGAVREPAAGASLDDRSVSWPRGVDASTEVIVANVGGRGIPLRELVAKWVLRDPGGVRAILDDIVLSRIIVYEAAALEIELPEGAIEEAVRTELARYEKEALAAGSPDLDTYVQKRLGMDPKSLLENLEKDAAINLLAPRCVRAWLLRSDRREIRAITVKDSVGVDQVQARLARGDDFGAIARELSTDPSAKEGGKMPPLVRGDIMLARAAFAIDVGQVSGPMEENGSLVFVKVEGAPARLEGLWPEIGPAVEASLESRKIEDPEFWQWKDAMAVRYEADVTPFLELAR